MVVGSMVAAAETIEVNGREIAILEAIRDGLRQRVRQRGLETETVRASGEQGLEEARARVLSTDEAIGQTRHRDYPLLGGRERLLEVSLGGGRGVAYTDAAADWQGTAAELLALDPCVPLHRALLVAALNAVMAVAGEIVRPLHCRGSEPEECAARLSLWLMDWSGGVRRTLLIGFQPRFVDTLTATVSPFRVIDRNPEYIGRSVGGTTVEGPDRHQEAMDWAELILATGSIFANGTAHTVVDAGKPLVIYGVSGAGPARLLGIPRFCMEGIV